MEPINENWVKADGTHDGGISTGIGFTIAWQRGPLDAAGRNGAFLIEVLESCLHQLYRYQFADFDRTPEKPGKYACPENQEAINHLELGLEALKARRDRRQQEGTLGTHQVSPNG
jgi:hypothetical protein